MKLKLPAGQTSVMLPIFVRDTSSSTGAGLSGLTSGTSGLVGEYRRRGASSWSAITLTSATLGTYTSGGWVADGSLAGAYEVGIPDAAIATAARWVAIRFYGAANMAPVLIELELDAVNYQDGTRFGLSALPNANAEASGGLITRGTGTGQMSVLGGAVSASVSSMGSGVIVAATFGANALGAVWDELKSAHTTANTYGAYLDAQSSTLATSSALTTIGSNVTTILGQTGTTGVVVAAGSKSGYSLTQSFPANFASLAITAGGAVTAGTVSDKTGYSLTQSFPSNFASMAITGGGAVTAGTVGDKTGYSLATAPPTAAAIATQVWSEAVPGSYASGTAGNSLGNVATGTPPTAAAIATQVWSTAVPGSFTSGQAGNVLGNVATGTPPTAGAIADAVWDEARSGHTTSGTFGQYVLARDDAGAALAAAVTLSSVASNVTDILDDTGTSGVVVAAGSKSGYTLTVTPPTAAQTATAVLTTALTESYAADGAAPTLTQAVLAIQQNALDASISGTTKTVKKLDGSTTALTLTLNDANTPSSISRTG